MVVSTSFEHDGVLGLKFGYHPFAQPYLYTHIYFVDGLLIDTGQSKARKQILHRVGQLEVEQIFITHHHEDHTGNIKAIKDRFGSEVYASAACRELMKAPPSISWAQRLTWGDREAFADLIPVQDTLATRHHSFQLIPIAGHATDMLALYEPERRWLFSADLYINSYIDYFLEGESMAAQIASLKKILKLDFKEVFCSHKPMVQNGREKLEKKLRFLESFYHQVVRLHEKGCAPNEIFREMKLKENVMVKLLSGGKLSKENMIKSALADHQRQVVSSQS